VVVQIQIFHIIIWVTGQFLKPSNKMCISVETVMINILAVTINYIRFEALIVAKDDKIFSGYQPCQLVKNYRRFRV
jgi:hypothetical protein